MKRLKGPELKLSELKVPPFLSDLYWDLRDRRLLPLVGLVLLAIVAVPFLLGGGSEEGEPPASLTVEPPAASGGSETSRLVAVEAKPGLRDYHKRLDHRSPTNPFKQRYTAPQTSGAELGGDLSSTSSTSTTTVTETTSSDGDSTTKVTTDVTDESGGDGGAAPDDLRLFSFAADIKITRSETKPNGTVVHGKPTVRDRVLPPSALPSEKAPIVNYLSISPKTKNPLLLISDEVTGVFGEGKCLSGAATCQLLEVEPKFPVTFVTGGGKVRYKIEILKVKPVLAGKY
jgi:hypothetical protein